MRLLKQLFSAAVGIAVFVMFVFLSGPAITATSHVLFKTTEFPDGQPLARFIVALRDSSKPADASALSPASWNQLAASKPPGRKFSYLLPGKGGKIPSEGDYYAYEVIEDRGSSQVIEVHFINTHTSWSRYEAFEDRIVPISYRTDGGPLMLVTFLAMVVVGFIAGRRVSRIVGKKLGVE